MVVKGITFDRAVAIMVTLGKFLKQYRIILLVFAGVFVFRLVVSYLVALDSDELMWAVMADEMAHGRQFFTYFATQNFRGALEAYFLIPFQVLFGFSLPILRINSILFGALSSVGLFSLFERVPERETKLDSLPVFAVILYNLMLPANLIIHTKAWGNYAFIEFAMIFSFFLFARWLEEKRIKFVILLGALFAISFWANMQSIYFVFAVLGFFFFGFLLEIRKEFDFLSLSALVFSFLNLYFLSQKRMIFNPALSLKAKLGIPLSAETISQFNIPLLYLIFVMWMVTFLWFLLRKMKNIWLRAFLITSNLFFAGVTVNVYHDSFSRVSAEGAGLSKMWQFFQETIVPSFIGKAWPLFLITISVGTVRCFVSFVRSREISWAAPVLFSVYAFPILFILSGVPKITPTPRYLLIWWAPLVISVIYGLVVIYRLCSCGPLSRLFGSRNPSIFHNSMGYAVTVFFLAIWSFVLFSHRDEYQKMRKSRVAQVVKSEEILDKIDQAGVSCCAGGYWEIGLVMAASGLDIKCYSREDLGRDVDYLDFYEYRYSDENCFEIMK